MNQISGTASSSSSASQQLSRIIPLAIRRTDTDRRNLVGDWVRDTIGHASKNASREEMIEWISRLGHELSAKGFMSSPRLWWNGELGKEEQDCLGRVGFIFAGYQVRYWYVELLELFRKFTMTVLVVLLFDEPPTRLLAGFVVTFLALLFFVRTMPYGVPLLNDCQITALLTQGLCLLYGLILSLDAFHGWTGSSGDTVVRVLLFSLHVLVLIFPLVGLIIRRRKHLFKIAKRKLLCQTKEEKSSDDPAQPDSPGLRHPLNGSAVAALSTHREEPEASSSAGRLNGTSEQTGTMRSTLIDREISVTPVLTKNVPLIIDREAPSATPLMSSMPSDSSAAGATERPKAGESQPIRVMAVPLEHLTPFPAKGQGSQQTNRAGSQDLPPFHTTGVPPFKLPHSLEDGPVLPAEPSRQAPIAFPLGGFSGWASEGEGSLPWAPALHSEAMQEFNA